MKKLQSFDDPVTSVKLEYDLYECHSPNLISQPYWYLIY
jgi:hypothetical protein